MIMLVGMLLLINIQLIAIIFFFYVNKSLEPIGIVIISVIRYTIANITQGVVN